MPLGRKIGRVAERVLVDFLVPDPDLWTPETKSSSPTRTTMVAITAVRRIAGRWNMQMFPIEGSELPMGLRPK